MGDEEREDEALDREEVAEDAAPETDTEATEQRTDDYDGLARRLDDIYDLISSRFDAMQEALDALGVATVEGTGVADETDAGEAAAQAIDEILGIDSLDLL
jgi:hypothetical protein